MAWIPEANLASCALFALIEPDSTKKESATASLTSCSAGSETAAKVPSLYW